MEFVLGTASTFKTSTYVYNLLCLYYLSIFAYVHSDQYMYDIIVVFISYI